MPIENHWANANQSILIEKFHDVWTWQQMIDVCVEEIHPILSANTYPVVLIQDMIGSHWTPTTNLLQEVQQVMKSPCPDRLKMMIVVSGDPAIDALVIAAYKRFGSPDRVYRSCSTINKALQIASDYLVSR